MATTATTGKKAPLLHFVTLYGLETGTSSRDGRETLEPRLLRCFPTPGSDPSATLRAPPVQTGVFCFPDIDRIRARYTQQRSSSTAAASPQPQLRAEQLQQRMQDINFTLLLTDDAGRRYYGFAQRLAMPGVTAAATAATATAPPARGQDSACDAAHRELPACVCVVTSHGWFQFWRLVLGWLTSRLLAYGDGGAAPGAALAAAWHDVEELVCTLLAKKDVRPGEMVSVTTGFSTRRRLSELARRPNDTLRPVGEDAAPLLKAVGVDGFVALFAALLLERRVVLVSASMRTLSRCVFAAQDALWPFAWQHVCIPVLPAAILDYLEAPMPFLIGAQHHHYLRMRALIADAVVVDLDAGTVDPGTAAAGDAALLPAAYAFHLRQQLAAAHRALGAPTGTAADDVYGACRLFLAKTVGHYERFLVRPLGCDRIAFDHAAFLASKQKPERRFWALFNESQMFRQFVAEKLDMLNSPRGVLFLTQFELDLNSDVHDDSVRYLSDTAKAQVKKFELKWKGNQTKQALKQNIRTMAAGAQHSLAKHHITSSSPTASRAAAAAQANAAPAGHAARVLRQFPRDAGRRVFPVDDPFATDFDEIQRMFAPQQHKTASVALQQQKQGGATAAAGVGTLIPEEAITGAPGPRTPSPAAPSCADMLFAGPSPSLLDVDIAPPAQPPLAQLAPGHRPLPQVPAMKPTEHRPPPPVPTATAAPAPTQTLTVDDFLTTTPLSSSSSSSSSSSTSCTDALFSDDTFLVNTPKSPSPFPAVPPRPKRDPFPKPPQTPPQQSRTATDPFPQPPQMPQQTPQQTNKPTPVDPFPPAPQPIDTFLVPMTTNNPFLSSGGASPQAPQRPPPPPTGTVFDLF